MSSEIRLFGSTIQGSDSGEYHVPESVIATLTVDDMQAANKLMGRLVPDNPEYEFSIDKEYHKGGYLIKWRKRV